MLTIFCPQCETLLLDAPGCPACGWRRPPSAEAGSRVWQYHAGAELRCSTMTLLGGRLLFGDGGQPGHPGAVHAIDAASGGGLWRTPLPAGAPADSLAAGGGRVYASVAEAGDLSPDKPLLALDAGTGDVLWSYSSGALNLSAPQLHGDRVYVASSDQRLHALDAASGRPWWTARLAAWGRAAPVADEDLLFLGTEQNTLLALDRANGRLRWSFDGQGWFAAPPAVHEGTVYAACWDGSLYALEARTGKPVWRFDLGPGAYLLASPVVDGPRILVGSRDHHLYAVDRRTGQESWRFETGRRVYAAPAVAGSLACLASDDHHLYALEAETGVLRWQVELPDRVRTTPLAWGPRLFVACGDGLVLALALETEQVLPDAQPLMERGEFAEAAAALALAGSLAEAASLYATALRQPFRAGQLYERAAEGAQAAQQYERAERPERALALWRDLGDTQAAVHLLRDLGRHQEAALELEQAGHMEEAANIYDEVLDQPAKAAHLYRQAGRYGKALALFARVGDLSNEIELLLKTKGPEEAARRSDQGGEYARAADLYLQAGQPVLAADVWARQGEPRRAAELYEQAGQLDQAATQYEKTSAWHKAATLYHELGRPLDAARCHETRGDLLHAGRAYHEAALRLEEGSQGRAEQELAELFERAARCFAQEFETEPCDNCRQKARYYRRQPDLALLLTQSEAFVQDNYNCLTVELVNHGRGKARDVELALVPVIKDTFAGELDRRIEGIGRLRRQDDTLSVLPRAAGKLALDVQVQYKDDKGRVLVERDRWWVDVRPEAGSEQFTPREIHVHGDYVAGKKVEGGDVIENGGQKGDRIEIRRGGVGGARLSIREGRAGQRCPACRAAQPLGAAFCEQCGARLEVGE